MTKPLRDVFGDLLGDEPPLELGVDQIVDQGRRRRARRRSITTASLAAALVSAVSLGAGYAISRPAGQAPDSATASDATPTVALSRSSSPTSTPPPTTSRVPTHVPSRQPTPGVSDRPSSTSTTGAVTSRPPTRPPLAPRNQLVDPGFEATPLNWDVFGPATRLAPTDAAHGGQQAVRITTTSTSPVIAGTTSRPVLVRTAAGTKYTASCWVRSATSLAAYLQVQEYTQDWKRAADPAKSPRQLLTDPLRWYRVAVTYTAAYSGNKLPLTAFGSDMTAGGPALEVDDCSLTSK